MKALLTLKKSALTTLLLVLLSCDSQSQTLKGYASGRAVNESGKPLANVRIRFFGTTFNGQRSSLNCRTAADGTYKLKLPAGQYSIREAIYDLSYEGEQYRLPLYLVGEDNDDVESSKGLSHQLILKTSGLIASTKDQKNHLHYFGGALSLETLDLLMEMEKRGEKGVKLIVQLSPIGNLMDGSKAKPLEYEKKLAIAADNRMIMDIPLGKYSATASLKLANGKLISLKLLAMVKGMPIGDQEEPELKTEILFKPKSGDATLLSYNGTEKTDLKFSL
ncbi:hypothetical protein D9M68_603850 [compost metagenome]